MRVTINCLLIDDDLEDQEIFKIALNGIQPTVECSFAQDGVEALHFLEKTQPLPDIIFLDINMPKMNGKEFLKAVMTKKELQGIPVVIYSTSYNNQTETEMRNLGASFYLTKPNLIKDLKEKLINVLKHLSLFPK